MCEFLKVGGRWLRIGWFWAFVLLALPNCGLDAHGCLFSDSCPPSEEEECDPAEDVECVDPDPVEEFKPGDEPRSTAIFCDFPKPNFVSVCATAQEALDGLSMAEAAVALVEGRNNDIALDWSDDALNQCGGPRKTMFLAGTFPDGDRVCLNCATQIDLVYATTTKACIAKCIDKINLGTDPIPSEGADEFCEANARTSTNYDKESCDPNGGGCTDDGNPAPGFDDPRKHQEKVTWIDLSPGVEVFGTDDNSLRRTAPATGVGDSDFNEGAGSAQTITTGDGWVQFEAGQNGVSHVIGLRQSCEDPSNCADTDYGLGGIGFAISLNSDNNVYVLESGTPLVVEGPFGTYTPGEKYRVRVKQNSNGTATITYARLDPGCTDGMVCTEDVFWTSESPNPSYPLRVDAIFREADATLDNVTIVRIKK